MLEKFSFNTSSRSARLNALMKSKELTPNAFSKEIGLSRSEGVYKILNEKISLSLHIIDKIMFRYPDTDIMWLLYGFTDDDRHMHCRREINALKDIIANQKEIIKLLNRSTK